MTSCQSNENYQKNKELQWLNANRQKPFQIIFDAFSVGRFDEGLVDSDSDSSDTSLTSLGDLPGCPEGFMQVRNGLQKLMSVQFKKKIFLQFTVERIGSSFYGWILVWSGYRSTVVLQRNVDCYSISESKQFFVAFYLRNYFLHRFVCSQVFHSPMQAATPFEFKIRYKFISQSDAVVR